MSEEIDQLWVLRGLDEELAQVRAALAKFPALKSELVRRLAGDQAKLDAHKKALGDLQLRRRELEREIEAVTQQERKFQSQQPAVKTNAEYQALTHEIQQCRDKRSELETRLLMLFDDEERIGAEKPALEKALAAAEADRSGQQRAIEADEAKLAAQAAGIEASRQAAMAALPAATRNRYERLVASRDGRAVVAILKNACGGCYRAQPPQLLQEARRRDRILTCDGCGRMLVFPPEGAVL